MPINTLRMIREGVTQIYPVKRATVGFSEPAPYSVPVFSIAIETERQQSIFPEDDGWKHAPKWSLDVWIKDLNDRMLLPGSEFAIPGCYDAKSGVLMRQRSMRS